MRTIFHRAARVCVSALVVLTSVLGIAPTAQAQTTALVFDSQPGDYIGQGVDRIYSTADASFSITSNFDGGVSLRVEGPLLSFWWYLDFGAGGGTPLAVGTYNTVRRFSSPFAGMDVSGSGRGCNNLTGRYVVREVQYGPEDTVIRFAADFEQHCEDAVPALFGAIRFNSTISDLVPFGGSYPLYRLTVPTPVNGRVAGNGVDCGGSGSACVLTLGGAAQVTLNAIPNPGYMFAGWTEDCHGGPTTSVHLNGPKRCGALFEPIASSAPRTLLLWNSHQGDFIGQGKTEVYSPANSRWNVLSADGGNGLSIDIDSVDDRSTSAWTLVFRAPQGQLLQAGTRYTGATLSGSATAPAINIFGNGRGCNLTAGEFTIRELVLGPTNSVLNLAVDFVQHCNQAASPPLTGSLRFNSMVGQPTMAADKTSLRFAAVRNASSFVVQPSTQAIRLTQTGPGTVTWTAVANQPWFTVSPPSGTGSAQLNIGVAYSPGLPASGNVTGTVTVNFLGATDPSITINLTLRLYQPGTTAAPIGTVDTPMNNATGVTGAIPFTGWALDDVEVVVVTLCRVAVGGESPPPDARCAGQSQVFVGNGLFIEGARPDVQAGFPTYPRSSRAGWGFMVLTNMLPNLGNGTYTFHAYARDAEGQVVLLGTRTITCDNANATTPFGTIDTPDQGGVISGAAYLNFGWVLTQNPKFIPLDGSTIHVFIDGVPIGTVNYNHYRDDISTLFPGLQNSSGPVGYRVVDTTVLTNGLHTISWAATDSGGQASGLGSRFFTVANGSGPIPADGGEPTSLAVDLRASLSASEVDALPLDLSPVSGRRGWDLQAAWHAYGGRAARLVEVRGEELDRIELRLRKPSWGTSYTGYQRVGSELRPLPIGASFDASRGAFTWAPGVGFVGMYDLVFVRWEDGEPAGRREVRIVLGAKGSAAR